MRPAGSKALLSSADGHLWVTASALAHLDQLPFVIEQWTLRFRVSAPTPDRQGHEFTASSTLARRAVAASGNAQHQRRRDDAALGAASQFPAAYKLHVLVHADSGRHAPDLG